MKEQSLLTQSMLEVSSAHTARCDATRPFTLQIASEASRVYCDNHNVMGVLVLSRCKGYRQRIMTAPHTANCKVAKPFRLQHLSSSA